MLFYLVFSLLLTTHHLPAIRIYLHAFIPSQNLVSVCREGLFLEEALCLSELHSLHSLHIDILCSDLARYDDVVRYICSLPFHDACEQMLSHGAVLARGCPDRTVDLLIRLATGYTPDNELIIGEVRGSQSLNSQMLCVIDIVLFLE